MNDSPSSPPSATLFGHPTGLFTLFFAEMWERFSFYGMRALLTLYMIKGFLGYNDDDAYGVYGAYTALVYAAPFIGGMLADRLLGARRAVVIGGLLMAAGHLLMTIEDRIAFFTALGLLICGNGFFKPNISTIVGTLYPKGSPKKDAGFTIFYMGINLGAAMAPIICGYVGETYGWHYGFGLATAGMLVGVAVFAAPTRLTQVLISVGALGTAVAMPFFQDSLLQLAARLFLAVALAVAGVIAVIALGRGGFPNEAGAPPDPARLSRKLGGFLRADLAVYLGIALALPVIVLLVQRNLIAGFALAVASVFALAYILFESFFRCGPVERDRVLATLILMFFSFVFWMFFEQAGSSVNNFTDRNVDRVFEDRRITESDVGSTITFRVPPKTDDPEIAALPLLTQEQLGYRCDDEVFEQINRAKARKKKAAKDPQDAPGGPADAAATAVNGERAFSITHLALLREDAGRKGAPREDKKTSWTVTKEHVGMNVGGAEIPTSEFQAVNPIYILLFGLVFSALWSFLGARGWEPSTPVKFVLGLLQLGIGFAALWYGARSADSRGMVAISWLLLTYLFHTTGELCISPVGLSMVTKLAPAYLVSTMMGAWFLATAISQYAGGEIAKLTGVSEEGAVEQVVPVPVKTVELYGSVYGWIAVASVIAAAVCLVLAPLLRRWMHEGEPSP